MASEMTAKTAEVVERYVGARHIELGMRRLDVVHKASRIVDVLRGVEEAAGNSVDEREPAPFDTAPDSIPRMRWTGTGITGKPGMIVGSLGEFFTERFNNERPADVFNTAFYAAVLAVKEGLIDPESFTHDFSNPQNAVQSE